MFVTPRQAHWMRDLPILEILSVMLLLRLCAWYDFQATAYVSEWILKSYGVSTDIKQIKTDRISVRMIMLWDP